MCTRGAVLVAVVTAPLAALAGCGGTSSSMLSSQPPQVQVAKRTSVTPPPREISAGDRWPGSSLVAVAGLGRLSFWCTADRRFFAWYVADRLSFDQSVRLRVGGDAVLAHRMQPGQTVVSPAQRGGTQHWHITGGGEAGSITATVQVSFAEGRSACLAPRVALTRLTTSTSR